MFPIIGLFRNAEHYNDALIRLKAAGIPEERITILTQERDLRRFLGCDPICTVRNYIAGGAVSGIALYALFALFAGLCQCNLMNFDQGYFWFTLLGGGLAGAFVGGAIGGLIGMAVFEGDTHLYFQGVRLGGNVIAVHLHEGERETVRQILEHGHASGIKTLPMSPAVAA